MNIFVLSLSTKKCAKYHGNRHVIKMLLESTQILCSAHIVLDNDEIKNKLLYKLAHKNHPCVIWARTSSGNYKWLYRLFCNLCKEYTYRYNKVHKCETKFIELLKNIPDKIKIGKITPFALAMPDKYKTSDPVISYRNYYIYEKTKIAQWKNRNIPKWYKEHKN